MSTVATRLDAYNLMHQGAIALAEVEAAGIAVDTDYLDRTIVRVTNKIRDLDESLRSDEVYRVWRREYGVNANLESRQQLEHVLFKTMGYPSGGYTARSQFLEDEDERRNRTDKAGLAHIDLQFVRDYEEAAEYRKLLGTYLFGLKRETVRGMVHSSISLHLVKTFRSCVAKGTMIEVVRDVSETPEGVPIEQVKAGDYVYCYDSNLKLTVRKVLWAGKTGHRRVVRVHWSSRGGRDSGHLDVTPEHKIRLLSGRYERAENLANADFRYETGQGKHEPKVSVLSMGRNGDRLWETGTKGSIQDHRLVYRCLVGPLGDEDVHHKDGNHLNNRPSNLQKMTRSEHSSHHAPEHFTDESRRKALASRSRNHAVYGDRWKSGKENPRWIDYGRFEMLRAFAIVKGSPTKFPHDYGIMMNKLEGYGISWRAVRNRYDVNGKYISLGRLRRVFDGTVRSVVVGFGVNYDRAKRLLAERGLSGEYQRESRNPWGRKGKPSVNNHAVMRVEWLEESVDVYDLEVEECHNFIANEICVHNSASDPNIQNQYKRNKKLMKLLRRAYVPREDDWVLIEPDFAAVEVRGICCLNHDPELIRYVEDETTDMHRDQASELFFLPVKFLKKHSAWAKATVRDWAKNRFVFPEFYGSVYFQCAPHIWQAAGDDANKMPDSDKSIREHLTERGITELGDPEDREPAPHTFVAHVKKCENKLWDRFKVYRQWKYDFYEEYKRKGYFDHPTGFRETGLYSRNDVTNHANQGQCFHWLLWSLIRIVLREFKRHRLRAKVVSEIHDCLLIDAPLSEVPEVLAICNRVMTEDIRRHWEYICVPLAIECDVSATRAEGGSWRDMEPWVEKNGVWQPKEKAA